MMHILTSYRRDGMEMARIHPGYKWNRFAPASVYLLWGLARALEVNLEYSLN